MGKTKDIKRKGAALALKERRLRRQGTPALTRASEQALREARTEGYNEGRRDGFLTASEEALDHAKNFKTAASIRKSIGSQVRRARGKASV